MAGRIPLTVFAPEELAELVRQRNEVIVQWQPLVWKIAQKLWHKIPVVRRIGTIEDLVQLGSLAIVKAIRCYNEDYRTADGQPVKFMTYVHKTIKTNMLREASATTLIYVPEYIRKVIAGYPGRDRYVDYGRKAMQVGQLSPYYGGEAKAEASEDDRLPDLRRALAFLSPDDRQLVVERFGLDGGEPASLREMAERRSRTKERIRQKLQRVCRQLRDYMPEDGNGRIGQDRQAAS